MLNVCPFTIKENATRSAIDGTAFYLPQFCVNNVKKCKSFYKKVFKAKQIGLQQCPNGFMIDGRLINGQFILIVGLNIITLSDRKKLKRNIKKNEFIPAITQNQYTAMITKFEKKAKMTIDESLINELNELKEELKHSVDQNELVNNSFHELRHLNSQLKTQSELLKHYNNINEHIGSIGWRIFSTSQLISVRLDTFDLFSNKDFAVVDNKIPTPVFKKFEKAYHCLKTGKEIPQINLIKSSYAKVDLTRIFELLPFILIENAIKYSFKGFCSDTEIKDINIYFHETESTLVVKIENWGPAINKDEIPYLFERSYRGRNTNHTEGHGFGLYIAKMIADINGIGIEIMEPDLSNRYFCKETNIFYSPFIVKLKFDLNCF